MLRLGAGARRGERRRRPARAARRTSATWPRRPGSSSRCPGGVWHVAAEGRRTWAEFAEAIFEEAGLDCRVVRITTAELGRPAPRPAYSVLRSERDGCPAAPALARGPAGMPRAPGRVNVPPGLEWWRERAGRRRVAGPAARLVGECAEQLVASRRRAVLGRQRLLGRAGRAPGRHAGRAEDELPGAGERARGETRSPSGTARARLGCSAAGRKPPRAPRRTVRAGDAALGRAGRRGGAADRRRRPAAALAPARRTIAFRLLADAGGRLGRGATCMRGSGTVGRTSALCSTRRSRSCARPGPTQGELVVAHQDFHSGNILRATREPWLAIDPKPLVGEREFDTASLLRDRRWELRADPHPEHAHPPPPRPARGRARPRPGAHARLGHRPRAGVGARARTWSPAPAGWRPPSARDPQSAA